MQQYDFKRSILAVATSALLALVGCVETPPPAEDINEVFYREPSAAGNLPVVPIYQATQGESLQQALDKIAQRSGITFHINTDISQDQVQKSIAAVDWDSAIVQLLEGYNYASVKNGKKISAITIINRGNKTHTTVMAKSTAELITIAPKLDGLNSKYRQYPPGSVMAIDLPVGQIMQVKDQADVQLDLPMGKFTVTHAKTVNEIDGSNTWVGYLKNEGPGYHVFVSQGQGGVMGHITTPDGTYNIGSDGADTYLFDTNKLKNTGFDGDMLSVASNAVLDAPSTNATDVSKAEADYNQQQLKLKPYTDKVLAAQKSQASALSAYNAANAVYARAYLAFKQAGNLVNQATMEQTRSSRDAAQAAYSAAAQEYNDAVAQYYAMATKLQADFNYLNAVKENLKTGTAAPAPTPTPQATDSTASASTPEATEIDIMVLYTTQGFTSEYAKQRLAYLVTASNQAYADSKMNMKLRLVYAEPTTYVENNANATALTDLANDRGVFAGVKAKRAEVGADLVYLFRPLYQKVAGSCGTTYVEFANGGNPNPATGYGTISDGNAKDSTGYYCAINTFTHEIGHSLGLVHETQNSVGLAGVFSDAYAWGIAGKFGTIMSYITPSVMLFSNPALTTACADSPCGFANSTDQLKAVNYTAPIVARFMPKLTQTPVIK